jgi:hypothetical protein
MKLVEDWKQAWKWFSVQAMGFSVILLGAWEVLPSDLKATLPEDLVRLLAIGLLSLGIGGRMVQQPPKDKQ